MFNSGGFLTSLLFADRQVLDSLEGLFSPKAYEIGASCPPKEAQDQDDYCKIDCGSSEVLKKIKTDLKW